MTLIEHIAKATGLATTAIRKLVHPGSRYRYREISRKRPGAARHICMPRKGLKAVHKAAAHWLMNEVQLHPAAHGFVPGRSIVTNARVHVSSNVLVTMDLESWFDHVNEKKLRAALSALAPQDVNLLLGLCLDQGCLPQGAPTSPLLANVAAMWLDRKLQAICNRWGWRYSRYADDLAFSSPGEVESYVLQRFVHDVTKAIHSCGWRTARGKTHVRRQHQRQEVTGLIVNGDSVRVPRELHRKLRAAMNNRKHKRPHAWTDEQIQSTIAFVKMVEPAEGHRLDIAFAHIRLRPITVEEALA